MKAARDFAKATLLGWGLDEMVEDLVLVVSELVTNALRYAQTPSPHHTDGLDLDWPIRLSLSRRAGGVLCAVRDPGDEAPVKGEPDDASESGRGLPLIDFLSQAWDWSLLDGGGKVVWALVQSSNGSDPHKSACS